MEILLLKTALLFYLLSTAAFVLSLWSSQTVPLPRALAPNLLLAAFIAHTGSIAARSLTAGYIAVVDAYEALSFFACLTAGVCLLAQVRVTPVAILGTVVSPLCFVVTLGAFVFYTQARGLPANLHSAWLPVHVTLAFLGNAVFGVAFSASLVYLVQERQLKLKGKKGRSFFRRLPSLETLDALNYQVLSWGFALLTLGILSGAVWAEYAWGRLWIWEPRPVLSLFTWVLYALLLYYRTAGWRGRRAATLTIVCFAVLVGSFLGVKLLFPGRHGGEFG
jgi:cytochrome c-type biogenesis protein CcsB